MQVSFPESMIQNKNIYPEGSQIESSERAILGLEAWSFLVSSSELGSKHFLHGG